MRLATLLLLVFTVAASAQGRSAQQNRGSKGLNGHDARTSHQTRQQAAGAVKKREKKHSTPARAKANADIRAQHKRRQQRLEHGRRRHNDHNNEL